MFRGAMFRFEYLGFGTVTEDRRLWLATYFKCIYILPSPLESGCVLMSLTALTCVSQCVVLLQQVLALLM